MATGHTVGIQKDPEAPIIFIHVDDLKICPSPDRPAWTPEASKARSLCASTVAFRPGSHVSDSDSSPSVDVSSWNNLSTPTSSSDMKLKLCLTDIAVKTALLESAFLLVMFTSVGGIV